MEYTSQNYPFEDKKPSAAEISQNPSKNQVEHENPEHINVKVEFPEGEFTNFKIKRVTNMEKLMKAFYALKGLQPGSVRLLLDDRRIHPNDTTETLNVMDGDVINAYSEQAGGKIPCYFQFWITRSESTNAGLEEEHATLISLIEEAEELMARLKREYQELLEKQAKIDEQLAEMRDLIEEEQAKIGLIEMEVELDMINIFERKDEN